MQRYTKNILVQEEDLDELQHVNNVRYVQWIQDISKEHWQAVAPEAMREKAVWVVQNHHIHYKGAAVLGDPIKMETYIQESRGAISTRVVTMHHGDSGALLLHSKTAWCLLHAETLKPMRIAEEISRLFTKNTDLSP